MPVSVFCVPHIQNDMQLFIGGLGRGARCHLLVNLLTCSFVPKTQNLYKTLLVGKLVPQDVQEAVYWCSTQKFVQDTCAVSLWIGVQRCYFLV